MDISPKNGLKRCTEPIDEFLRTEGYFRKNSPHDATCLFRAVSEQIYLTQYYHLRVRQQCVDYMRQNKELFEESIKISYDSYLEQLSCVTEWGGNLEIQAMSRFYKRDFVIFNAQKLDCSKATAHGFEKSIYLCQLTAKVYESVFKREFMSTAAFCQSLVYQTLYKTVFNLPEIDDTVQKMLHEHTNIRHNRFFSRSNLDQRDQLSVELFSKIESESSDSSKAKHERAPFPYRIAKALDPNIYRNIDFDIWHEIRREVRCAGWTRWNDSELRIGAKCLVQLHYDKENIDDTNNNVHQSLSKQVPALLIGHIQEMGKSNEPVVVFIEALGEKRRVPYAALKPVLATRKPQAPLGVVSPRKNWRNKWMQSNKTKDITSIMLNSIDSFNNNDCEKEKKSSEWSDDKILNNFTGIENYSSGNDFVDAVEVRPVSIVLDNQIAGEQKEDKPTNFNNNNPMMNNNNNIGQETYEKTQSDGANVPLSMMQPSNQPSPAPQHQVESYYGQSAPAMFAPSTNMMCVSSEGAMYPVQYYSGGQGEAPQPPGQDRDLRPINITAPFSIDINGNDLPYSDPSTLRFFYNLGINAFRCGHVWQPGQLAYGSPFLPPAIPIASPAIAADAPQPLQISPRNEESGGRQGQQKRRPDQSGNSGRNSGMSGDGRTSRNYSRKGENDGNFQRNETPTVGYDYQKNRGYGNNEEKEGNQKKNTQGRYKKNNNEGFSNSSFTGRNRNFERTPQFQQDYQKPRETPPSSFRNENQSFNRARVESSQQSPQQSPQNQFQQSYGQQQQPVFNSVQYYPESETYYPPNANFYPVPLMQPPPDAPDSNVGPYVCTGPDNYPPPMSPMYSPYVFPPPPIYQGVPGNHQDNWYPMPGNQSQYVPYQVPVTQPPPNISNRPPTTS